MYLRRLFLTFKGRVGRRTFWLTCWLTWFLATLLMVFVLAFAEGLFGYEGEQADLFFGNWILIWIFVSPFLFMALQIKRLHDRNLSAWWSFLGVIPFVSYLWWIVLGFLPGTKGQNRYGPDPHSTEAEQAHEPLGEESAHKPDHVKLAVAKELYAEGKLSRAEYEVLEKRLRPVVTS